MAKIDKVYTWKEYSTLSLFEERKDSYYVLRNGKVDWRKKIDGLHDDRDALEHDCALGLCCKKGVSEEDVFTNEKHTMYLIKGSDYPVLQNISRWMWLVASVLWTKTMRVGQQF